MLRSSAALIVLTFALVACTTPIEETDPGQHGASANNQGGTDIYDDLGGCLALDGSLKLQCGDDLYCNTDEDCGEGGRCTALGECSYAPSCETGCLMVGNPFSQLAASDSVVCGQTERRTQCVGSAYGVRNEGGPGHDPVVADDFFCRIDVRDAVTCWGGLSWIMGLTAPLFEVLGQEISGRDLILLGGGLFLIGKATHEIYENIEHPREEEQETKADAKRVGNQFALIMVQIIFLDVVFSLDSVITAVGMAQSLAIMVAAMVLAVGVMMAFAGPVGDFVQENNSVKVLALSFLVLIGVLLLADGLGQHVSKGYVYFAMGFAMMVELVNMRRRRKALKARALAAASSAGGADDGGT